MVSITYVGIIVILCLNETYLVYPGSKYPRGDWETTQFQFEEVAFEAADGTKLVGWFLPFEDGIENANETVLLCHGNAENCAQASSYIGIEMMRHLRANVFVFDYRGYGKSEGSPDEAGIKLDAVAALNVLNSKTETQPHDVILVGHSLGGGPAVFLAKEHGAKALVLQRTYCSLVDAAQSHYPWLPVSLMMRNRFDADGVMEACDVPLFQSHGDCDEVIPLASAKRLFEKSPTEKKTFYEIPGMSHYQTLPDDYWTKLESFVSEIPQ